MAVYREIFEKIPDGITLHDASTGAIVDTNQQFCEMLGYTREELLEKDFGAIHVDEPPYTAERAREHIRAAATEGPQTFEWLDQTKAGDPLPVEVHLRQTAIDGADRILAVVRDISERRRREREHARTRDQMEFALEATDTVIWTIDLETGDASVFGPIERLLGTDPGGVEPFLSDVVHPDDRERITRVYESVSRGDSDEYDVEFRTTDARDSGNTWISSQGYVRQPADDGPRQLIGIATDVTDRKERQRELERTNERLEEFAGVVSHDLRNPLNVAEQRLYLARTECETEHLDGVERAHERMRALIEDVLTLAREGEMAVEVESVDLADVVVDCWQSHQATTATLEVETERTIRADVDRLRQVLDNLLGNAVRHGGEGVTVCVGDLDDGFYVEDTGPGIPADEREAIFEPGYSNASGGTGLGLQIVAEIADAHEWSVEVAAGDGGGARFEVRDVVCLDR